MGFSLPVMYHSEDEHSTLLEMLSVNLWFLEPHGRDCSIMGVTAKFATALSLTGLCIFQ